MTWNYLTKDKRCSCTENTLGAAFIIFKVATLVPEEIAKITVSHIYLMHEEPKIQKGEETWNIHSDSHLKISTSAH